MTRRINRSLTQAELNAAAHSASTLIQRVQLEKLQKLEWVVTLVQGVTTSEKRAIGMYHNKSGGTGWLLPCGTFSRHPKVDLLTMAVPKLAKRRGIGSY